MLSKDELAHKGPNQSAVVEVCLIRCDCVMKLSPTDLCIVNQGAGLLGLYSVAWLKNRLGFKVCVTCDSRFKRTLK